MTHDRKGPVTNLKEELEDTEKSCKVLREDYLRALAEFENYRRRVERDSEQSRRLALERLILDLLPVLDNFERAAQAVGGERKADSVRTGIELIYRQLRDVLCRHGLKEYSCVGAEFDPRRAEAISFVHTDEHKPGTVVSEACKGYACGERVLRPARVVVAKEPERTVGQGPLRPSQTPEAGSQSAEPEDAKGRGQKPKAKSQKPDAEAVEIAEPDSESNP